VRDKRTVTVWRLLKRLLSCLLFGEVKFNSPVVVCSNGEAKGVYLSNDLGFFGTGKGYEFFIESSGVEA